MVWLVLAGLLIGPAVLELRAQEPMKVKPTLPPRDTRPAQPPDTASGVIRGIITSAETGRPLRRVNVSAQRVDANGRMPVNFDPGGTRAAITDDEGRFTLSDLRSGRWTITASRAGYLTQQPGQKRPFETPPPVRLEDGQTVIANMALTRAGAINGRVYDEYGDPVAGVRIQPLRPRMIRRQRYLQPVGSGDLTDDTGAFRLHGLPPGEYYIAASLRVAPLDSVVQTTYAPTYYPGSGNFGDAQRVFVGAGADVHADFPVRPVRPTRITGYVQDSSGAPADAFLNLMSDADELGAPLGIGTATRDDGSFLLADVPPGAYTLYASLRSGGLDGEVAALPVTVYEEDLTGVTLVTAKPGSMRVRLVADAGVTRALPEAIDLVARSVRAGNETKHGAAERANPSAMMAPPGPFRLAPDIPDRWALKAVVVDSTDMTDSPIDLKGQQDVPVRLVLTDKLTEISGSVTVERPGQPIGVVVFAEDSGRWRQPSRFVRSTTTDERGAFRISGLPGGVRYLAIAIEGLEEGEGDDADFLTRMKDHAVSFPLADGETRVIGLALEERR
jgi:hypothetical protein